MNFVYRAKKWLKDKTNKTEQTTRLVEDLKRQRPSNPADRNIAHRQEASLENKGKLERLNSVIEEDTEDLKRLKRALEDDLSRVDRQWRAETSKHISGHKPQDKISRSSYRLSRSKNRLTTAEDLQELAHRKSTLERDIRRVEELGLDAIRIDQLQPPGPAAYAELQSAADISSRSRWKPFTSRSRSKRKISTSKSHGSGLRNKSFSAKKHRSFRWRDQMPGSKRHGSSPKHRTSNSKKARSSREHKSSGHGKKKSKTIGLPKISRLSKFRIW